MSPFTAPTSPNPFRRSWLRFLGEAWYPRKFTDSEYRSGGSPAKEKAPSNLSITGRYILQPEIFAILETQPRGAGGEIQLTDAMIALSKSQKFYAVDFEGERHDCGSKAGFLRANIAYGLARPDLRDGLRAEMKKYLGK